MGALLKKATPRFVHCVPMVANFHSIMAGAVIVANAGSGPQLDHTNMSTPPEVPMSSPPTRDICGCYLSSFLCLSEVYQVEVQARIAIGEAGQAWRKLEPVNDGVVDANSPPPPVRYL